MSEILSRVNEGLPENLKKEYKEVLTEKTSSGSIRHYGVRKSTQGKDPVSATKLIKSYGYDPKEKNPFVSGIWSTSHGDIPINVIGIHGRLNGEDYLKIEGANTGVPRSDIRFNSPEQTEAPQVSEFENRLGQMEQRISALESQLQEVTQERDELRVENQELNQKIAQLESGETPQPAPDFEENITSEEIVAVVEAPKPPAEQTVTVNEVETLVPPNAIWRDKLNNFIQGRSLHNSVMYYRENGILKREETVEERDDRWKAAAVVIGGIALLLLIKRYGFDWGDDHHNRVIGDNDNGIHNDIDSRMDEIEDRLDDYDDKDGFGGNMGEDDYNQESPSDTSDDNEDDSYDKTTDSAAAGGHVEVFNEQHGDRSVQSILPGNLEQERIGLHERIIDKDTGDVIVEQVTYKQNGPYSEATVAKLRSAGYRVSSMPFDIYDTVGPGPRGEVRHYLSIVR